MDCIEQAFKRMGIAQIRAFLLNGTDDFEQPYRTYNDSLKYDSKPIHNRLKCLYANDDDLDKANADLAQALTSYESVYMELGMKAGVGLIYELLLTNDQAPIDK